MLSQTSLRRPAALLLILSSLYSVALVIVRLVLTGEYHFFFMIWNLCLAWLPLVVVLLIVDRYRNLRWDWLFWLLILCWVIFLPNAFYMLTDFVHLRHTAAISFWFDLVMIASFAWNGMLLGMLSVSLMHSLTVKRYGERMGWFLALGVLFLAAIGVYIGRFVRFNSWDVIINPGDVGGYLASSLTSPAEELRSYAWMLYFFLFFAVTYATLRVLGQAEKRN